MKLYTSIGPNPHVVRMFVAEKGLDIATVEIDLRSGENRQADYTAKNRTGTTPALELPDGTVVSEITTICEYLEELHPEPALVGRTPEERAETRMWTRRIDLSLAEPLTNGFRATTARAMFESRVKLPSAEAGEQLKEIGCDRLRWFDAELAGREWVCGDRFTLADVMLYCFLTFSKQVGIALPADLQWVSGFLDRAGERPSAK